MTYFNFVGDFSGAEDMVAPGTSPNAFWSLFEDQPLAPFVREVGMLPCNSASCERVNSALNFGATCPERVTLSLLAMEMLIRWNCHLGGL